MYKRQSFSFFGIGISSVTENPIHMLGVDEFEHNAKRHGYSIDKKVNFLLR